MNTSERLNKVRTILLVLANRANREGMSDVAQLVFDASQQIHTAIGLAQSEEAIQEMLKVF